MTDDTLRPMTLADLRTAVDFAAAEGWNPGLDDSAAFFVADPGGFLGAYDGEGRLSASISVVAYGPSFGFLGFYIVRPDRRGQGLGWRLWQAGMAQLGGRTVGLDGVVAQQANYGKSGFVLAHRNVRYAGPAPAVGRIDPSIRAVDAALCDAVIAYDRPLFPAERRAFLGAWLSGPSRRTLAFLSDGAIRGYGTIRPCREGHKIGPLLADTPAIAAALAEALIAPHSGETVVLDPPEPNTAAVALAERLGLKPVFETARMYKGPAPDLDLSRIHGITTFELG